MDAAGEEPRAPASGQELTARLESLRRAFGSDAAIAGALGIDPARLARWRRGESPDTAGEDRLSALCLVVEMLSGALSDSRIPKWLHGANAHLGDRTPLGVLRMGDLPAVTAAVRALESGAHA
jgi:hypothetical protein